MKFDLIKKLHPLKFPRILVHKDLYYLYGIEECSTDKPGINKFKIINHIYDKNFELLQKRNLDYKFDGSALIWKIKYESPYYQFLIECKSIDEKNHSNTWSIYYVHFDDLDTFSPTKIEPYNKPNHLIFDYDCSIVKTSKLESDPQNPGNYWGKYLFLFFDGDKAYKPNFDTVVNYETDKGHLLHDHYKNLSGVITIIFSIRESQDDKSFYTIYTANTVDWYNFYNVEKIVINSNLAHWYCYPEPFLVNQDLYMVVNQDDFGKQKDLLLLKLDGCL